MNTLYDVLGVPPHANEKTIRTAFRKAAKSFHPDLNAGDPTAELQFRQLVAAYELLKNPQQREAYDLQLKEDRRQQFRRIASPIISGVVSGSIVAAVMLWLNAQKPAETEQAPRLAVASVGDPGNRQVSAVDNVRNSDVNREGALPPLPPPATDNVISDDTPPPAARPEAESPLAREWERVRASGDAMAIWEFAVRNPDASEAQLARARLLTLIETSDNVFLLQVLRIGAPDLIAERARARLAHLGVPATTDEASSSDTSSSSLEERAAAFMSVQIAAWLPANRNLSALTRAYAEEVYYDGGLKPRAIVIRDKRRSFERSPERVYAVQPGTMKTECVGGVCRVSGVLEWQARNAARSTAAGAGTTATTGAMQFEYGLIFSRGVFSILSENSSPVKATVPVPEARPLPSRQEAAKQQASRQEPKQDIKQEPSAEEPKPEPSGQEAPKQEPSVQEPPDNP
jgi:curved DNA-binding protein CbpA